MDNNFQIISFSIQTGNCTSNAVTIHCYIYLKKKKSTMLYYSMYFIIKFIILFLLHWLIVHVPSIQSGKTIGVSLITLFIFPA